MTAYQEQLDLIREGNKQSARVDDATGKFIEFHNYPGHRDIEEYREAAPTGTSWKDITKEDFANLMVDYKVWKWESDTLAANSDETLYQ